MREVTKWVKEEAQFVLIILAVLVAIQAAILALHGYEENVFLLFISMYGMVIFVLVTWLIVALYKNQKKTE